jgi:hypothetical protein
MVPGGYVATDWCGRAVVPMAGRCWICGEPVEFGYGRSHRRCVDYLETLPVEDRQDALTFEADWLHHV